MFNFLLVASIAVLAILILGLTWAWIIGAAHRKSKKRPPPAGNDQSNLKSGRDSAWDIAVKQSRTGPR